MSDFAPNYTARLRIRYRGGGVVHTQTWRYPGVGDGPELGSAIVGVTNFYSALAPVMWSDWSVLNVSFALRDSDIFLPTFGIAVVGAVDVVDLKPRGKASAISFVGRTQAGLRAIIYQYGYRSNIGESAECDDFRINPGEAVTIDDAVTSLIATGSDFVGNDGQPINWYSYANIKYNDYWERKVRQSG